MNKKWFLHLLILCYLTSSNACIRFSSKIKILIEEYKSNNLRLQALEQKNDFGCLCNRIFLPSSHAHSKIITGLIGTICTIGPLLAGLKSLLGHKHFKPDVEFWRIGVPLSCMIFLAGVPMLYSVKQSYDFSKDFPEYILLLIRQVKITWEIHYWLTDAPKHMWCGTEDPEIKRHIARFPLNEKNYGLNLFKKQIICEQYQRSIKNISEDEIEKMKNFYKKSPHFYFAEYGFNWYIENVKRNRLLNKMDNFIRSIEKLLLSIDN